MTILVIIAIILFLVSLGYATYKINEYGTNRYGYLPFNLVTMALVVVPYIVLFLSLFMGDKHAPLTGRGDFLVAVAAFAVTNIVLILLLIKRTSATLTLVVVPVMHTLGILMIVLYVSWSLITGIFGSDRRDR